MKEYIVKVNTHGDRFWHLNNQLHREGGPAIELANGDKFWYLNGKLHREDGPAVEIGTRHRKWYLNGVEMTKQELIQRNCEFLDLNGKLYRLVEWIDA